MSYVQRQNAENKIMENCCNKCGNEKHCNTKLYKEYRCWQDKRRGEICCCEKCECADCIKEVKNGKRTF